MFAWFRRWRRRSQSDRTERNMVIRRIVSAVADESLKKQTVRPAHATADEPRRTTTDGRPITPLPAGKPPSDSKPVVTHLPAGKPPSNGRPFAPLPADPPLDGEVSGDRVAQRAFEIWVRNGRPAGTHDADWAQAAAELRAEQLYRPADPPK